MGARIAFFVLLAFVAIPSRWASPPVALLLGVAFGMTATHPYAGRSRRAAKTLLQTSVVALGFAMNLDEVLRAGRSGFVYTLVGIGFTLAAGTVVARALRVAPKAGWLISVGTAICGGSAIAAMGPAVEADDGEMSVAMGTVFLLNAAGLVLFPPLGHALGLDERAFGLWAALAIHDTSSVVGAAAKFGPTALTVATTVKLARALWIVPLTLATAAARAARSRREEGTGGTRPARAPIQWPWFILFFLLAAIAATYVPAGRALYPLAAAAGRVGLSITLFLIGTGMSRASLAKVGPRPLVLGVLLWALVATSSIGLVRAGIVS
jgi:uncharacterized integral membrane protein (TIGR00698 family)